MDVSFENSINSPVSFSDSAPHVEREEIEMSSETSPQSEEQEIVTVDPSEDETESGTEISVAETPNSLEGVLDTESIKEKIILSLHRVYDPEIPVNIYELGLIYSVDVSGDGVVNIDMTLTSPACPVAGSLVGEVELMASSVEGVSLVSVNLTWDPPWTPYKMSEAARLELNFW